MTLLETLADKGVIPREDVAALHERAEALGGDVEAALINHGVSRDDILRGKADQYGIPFKSLENQEVPFEILKYVPEESATFYRFVPLGLTEGALNIGIVDPDNLEAMDALNFISGKLGIPYKLYLISEGDFERVLQSYKGLSGEVTKALTELETDLIPEDTAPSRAEAGGGGETHLIEEAPVTKIVATILQYATEGRASDIHIEHVLSEVRVRFRVDGVLTTSLILPAKVHAALIARVKILSNMRLDEKRKPQDGRFSARIEGRRIDFRVSTFPSYYGEKVVMRILDAEKGVRPLQDMGLSSRNLSLIREVLNLPYGLVLISGPTGSGKSTTLYTMLNEIDREKYNVLSLEDPVEYNIAGMSQSQIRPEIGYTFASGLRHTLRQDPDIIMVGEIRDKETAQLAVQAALTGHLVFSTLHTNNAVGVIPRLIDMGVDPYLIPPTLALAMAQRLVQLICPGTGKKVPFEGSVKALALRSFADLPEEHRQAISLPKEVLEIAPAPDCPKGTRGRTAVFEIMRMDKELEQAILKNPSESEIVRIARQQGMLTMKEDAMLKAFRHEIPWEEVNKL